MCTEAAIELLIGHGCWVVRDDFVTRFVEVVPGFAGGATMACIDWVSALAAVRSGRLVCSSSEEQILRVAASLAMGAPVDLRSVLTALDQGNVGLVAAALRHVGGAATAEVPTSPGARPAQGADSAVTQGPPSRNDGVTVRCLACGAPVARGGRRRYCSDACRQAGWRRRHGAPSGAPQLRPRQPRRAATVYVCSSCETRYVGLQRCPECNLFCAVVGVGGCCPACDEPVAYEELTRD